MKGMLSIVIPMYNEEKNAENVIATLDRGLTDIAKEYEIIVVESGSLDHTGEIIDALAKKYKNLQAVHQEKKEGLGSAIRCGFRMAKGDYILYMDGDDPFDIKEIKQAFPLLEGADAVIGYRIGPRESLARWLLSKSFNLMIRTAFGVRARDINFSCKLFKKRVIENIDIQANKWFIDAEILAEMRRKGLRFREIGIRYKMREKGSSSVRVGPGLVLGILKEAVAYARRRKR